MPVIIKNKISIACPVESLFGYVTQPWLWHEWHPNSKSAKASVDNLMEGDSFDEVVELQPLLPIPITMKRQTEYLVFGRNEISFWEVKGIMKDGWLKIRYEFQPSSNGTDFIRTLTFEATGLSRLLMPMLKKNMEVKSLEALNNLKDKLE